MFQAIALRCIYFPTCLWMTQKVINKQKILADLFDNELQKKQLAEFNVKLEQQTWQTNPSRLQAALQNYFSIFFFSSPYL